MKRFFFFLIFVLSFSIANAQSLAEVFFTGADSLAKILFSNLPDEEKVAANQQLEALTFDFLQHDTSLQVRYDSLLFVSYLQPEDETFGLLTWAVPLTDYKFLYSGFLQKINHKQVDTVYHLKPLISEMDNNVGYTNGNWPQAVYNQILPKGKKEKYYKFL